MEKASFSDCLRDDVLTTRGDRETISTETTETGHSERYSAGRSSGGKKSIRACEGQRKVNVVRPL